MYKFTHFPKPIDREEYDLQQDLFLDFCDQDENIIWVYSIWECGLLWVSDLDYLIVFQNSIDKEKIRNLTRRYNLIDTILFLNVDNIENINYISHHFHYNLVYGKDFSLQFPKENKNLNIIYAWRVCFFSLLRNFYFYKQNQNIDVKNILSQIYDIRYPIYFLENLWIKNVEYTDFLDDFSNFRNTYFSHQNYEKLEYYLIESIRLSWDIISDLNSFLEWNESNEDYIYWRFPTIFSTFDDSNSYKDETERLSSRIWKWSRLLYLPKGFNYHSWEWSLKENLCLIRNNNNEFLNFWFSNMFLNFVLSLKKILDFITLRTLWKRK